jgi:DNA-directed RNA polymerase subunit N (RpoN/RPB10)
MLFTVCHCGKNFANIQIPYDDDMDRINNKNISKEDKNKEKINLIDKYAGKRFCCRMKLLGYLKLIDIML